MRPDAANNLSHTGFQRYLSDWFNQPRGHQVLTLEQRLLDKHLNKLFGYFLLQVGRVSSSSLLATSRIKNHVLVDETQSKHAMTAERLVLADLMAQPFAAGSLDLVLLPHTLESTQDPYRLIRYIDELVRPDGHLVISGFNPMSCLVIRQRLGVDKTQWRNAHIIKMERLIDWLRLLGYEILIKEYSSGYCFEGKLNEKLRPIIGSFAFLGRQAAKIGLSLAPSYIIVARKQQLIPLVTRKQRRLTQWVSSQKPIATQARQNDD